MNVKFFAAAAAFLAIGSAQAANTVITLDSTGSASFSSSAASQTYEFTLATDVTGDASVVATLLKTSGYAISSVLFDSVAVANEGSTKFENYTLFSGALSAGTHYITITGTSLAGATYTGSIEVTPAVPEPESLALAFAGLGVAGFIARRRKQA
jgi:hypothetical protein